MSSDLTSNEAKHILLGTHAQIHFAGPQASNVYCCWSGLQFMCVMCTYIHTQRIEVPQGNTLLHLVLRPPVYTHRTEIPQPQSVSFGKMVE